MAPKENQYLAQFDLALEAWTDERFISRKELRAVAMFNMYLVNLLDDIGWQYYGHTYSQKSRMGCLVVKADHEGTPHVVFTNARTYPGSVIVFMRRLAEDTLEWRPDRYRG